MRCTTVCSPAPRRLVFSALISMAAVAVPLLDPSSSKSLRAVPLIAGAFVISVTSMITNLGLSANYFGTIDREGFATLAASPLDRRLVILSANLTALLFVGAVHLLLTTAIAAFARKGLALALPLGLAYSLCLYLSTLKPLARLLQSHEHSILQAVATAD